MLGIATVSLAASALLCRVEGRVRCDNVYRYYTGELTERLCMRAVDFYDIGM